MSPSRLAPAPRRTLLLAPPSLSAHPAALSSALAEHDASTTDMEMLDRVAAGHAALAPGAYDAVVLLPPADAAEGAPRLGRAVVAAVAAALAPDGRVAAARGGAALSRADRTEGILAGLLVAEDGALVKPRPQEAVALPRRGAAAARPPAPPGVGFVGFGGGREAVVGEGEDEDDDELVDEDDLLTEEDRAFVQRESLSRPFAASRG
jgi:hypothetical protein